MLQRGSERMMAAYFQMMQLLETLNNSWKGVNKMSPEENKQLLQSHLDDWNRGNWEGVYSLYAEDFVDHNPKPGQAPGKEGLRQSMGRYFEAFPDSQIIPGLLVAEGDLVADTGFMTGTHTGTILGIPPTGKKVKIAFLDIHRFKDGKIVEGWHLEDSLGILQQIGALPLPEAPRAKEI